MDGCSSRDGRGPGREGGSRPLPPKSTIIYWTPYRTIGRKAQLLQLVFFLHDESNPLPPHPQPMFVLDGVSNSPPDSLSTPATHDTNSKESSSNHGVPLHVPPVFFLFFDHPCSPLHRFWGLKMNASFLVCKFDFPFPRGSND